MQINDLYSIYVLMNVGSMNDPFNKLGMAHLVEHLILNALNTKTDYIQGIISISGKTNYNFTLYKIIHIGDNNIEERIMDLFLNNYKALISSQIIGQTKRELLLEIKQRENDNKSINQIHNFITDGEVKNLPIGKSADILSISAKDILQFLGSYYIKNNFTIIDTNINLKNKSKLRPHSINFDIKKMVETKDKLLIIKKSTGNLYEIKIYIHCSEREWQFSQKLLRVMLQVILQKKQGKQLSGLILPTINFERIYVTCHFAFNCISLQSNFQLDRTEISNILKKLRNLKISSTEYSDAKLFLKKELEKSIIWLDEYEIVENYIANMIYGEISHIDYISLNKMIAILLSISQSDLNNYIDKIFSRPARIVVLDSTLNSTILTRIE